MSKPKGTIVILERNYSPKWKDGVVRTVSLKCPKCAAPWIIGRNHAVQGDGRVKPGVNCLNNACDFNTEIFFDDWGYGPIDMRTAAKA